MGNWRNRIPRRFYNQKSSDYPPRYHLHDPFPDYRDDGVPVWEKKFCTKIGKVPWQKIVDNKKFMSSYHGNIVSWNDSEGEEAFQNAKRRYWAEINGRSCDISLPDPDMYIDEINWNLDVVPASSDDWEQDILVPNDVEKECDEDHENKRTSKLLFIPPEGWDSNPIEVDDPWPWESNDDSHQEGAPNVIEGWDNWDEEIHNSRHMENNYNPWKYDVPLVNKSREHTEWGRPDDKFPGLNQWGAEINQLASYDAGISWNHGEADSMPYNGWGDSTDNKPCDSNQHVSDNRGYENSHWNQGPIKSRAQDTHKSSYVDKYIWEHKQQEHQNVWTRKPDSRSNWRSHPWKGGGGQKRGSYQNAADHRNQRYYQRDGGQRGQYWSVKSNTRGSALLRGNQ